MSVSIRHIASQGGFFRALARGAVVSTRHLVWGPNGNVETPGPEVFDEVAPPSRELVHDYVAHVGGDPSAYAATIPAHLFPQWSIATASRALGGVRYPLHRVLTAGCRIEQRGALRADRTLRVRARLESIARAGCCDVLRVRIVTGSGDDGDAVVVYADLSLPAQGRAPSIARESECPPPRTRARSRRGGSTRGPDSTLVG